MGSKRASRRLPLYKLPWVVKGFSPPTEIMEVFERRKRVQRDIISSHGEASRFFLSFLDNHDMTSRIRAEDPGQPGRYQGQVIAALGCMFGLQGIPCVYYGTEQGLSGSGSDKAVREAMWGRPGGFDDASAMYVALQGLAAVRGQTPTLRYGRQYFRPVSGDRKTFGFSTLSPGVLAWSRILNETEVVCVLNTDIDQQVDLSVLVDSVLHDANATFGVAFSSTGQALAHPVERFDAIVEGSPFPPGAVNSIRVALDPGEFRILRQA